MQSRLGKVPQSPEFFCNEAVGVCLEVAVRVGGGEPFGGEERLLETAETDGEGFRDEHHGAAVEFGVPWLNIYQVS